MPHELHIFYTSKDIISKIRLHNFCHMSERMTLYLADPLPLPPRSRASRGAGLTSPLLRIEHQAQHIKCKLWELQAHAPKLLLGLSASCRSA